MPSFDFLIIGSQWRPIYIAPIGSDFGRGIDGSGVRTPEYERLADEMLTAPLNTMDLVLLRTKLSDWNIAGLRSSDDSRAVLAAAVKAHKLIIADQHVIMNAMRDMRAKIAKIAVAKIGATAWSYGVTNGGYGPDTNKCNLFVHDVLAEAGANPGLPHGWRHPSPPMAGDWTKATYEIPHWRVLTPREHQEPGDVVAQLASYSDASGHVMIVGPSVGGSLTFIGTDDGPTANPAGIVSQIAEKPLIVSATVPHGPEVFRRWDPLK